MNGEVIMQIPLEEMTRAMQIYMDEIFKVPVRVVSVKQMRAKDGRFEIKIKGIGEVKESGTISIAPPETTVDWGKIERQKTLEEIRNAGNNINT